MKKQGKNGGKMNMKRRIEAVICLCMMVCLVAVCLGQSRIQLPDDKVPMNGMKGLVIEGERDIVVIPDKYNSGCDETKIINEVNAAGEYGGLNFKLASGGTVLAVDFLYGNKDVEDVVTIQNTDFSKCNIEFRNGTQATSKKEIIFENCRFGSVRTEDASGNVSFVFKQCSFTHFNGSCASFDGCYFGGEAGDALNPLQNVTLTNCYIADLAHARDQVVHVDGTQIFGRKEYDAKNITFKNCRMEIPNLKRSGSNSGCYVNACLMVALEFNDANNLLFEDCIINGGGYSIYAVATPGYELNDVVFRNIQVGNAHMYGNIYYKSAPKVEYDNVYDAEKLYVASVWKDNGKIHLSVSNDTQNEHKLVVVTESGREEFTIPACPRSSDVPEDTAFEEMPFDIDIIVPDSDWVVCYDGYESKAQQIRFVNWGGKDVFLEEAEQMETDFVQIDSSAKVDESLTQDEEISDIKSVEAEGMCGKEVFYKLDESGSLTISGTGAMQNFNSVNPAPWKEYKEDIISVVVEEGVTSIGSQAFNGCSELESVDFPDTLETINSNAFQYCSLLTEIAIPNEVSAIKERAFIGTKISTVFYAGDEEAFQKINIESQNDPIINSTIEYNSGMGDVGMENEEQKIEGVCGKNISYSLDSDGTLIISGMGEMYNFSSVNSAPWKEYKDRIKNLIVENGVTSIGSQAFNGCSGLEKVDLPDTLDIINSNAFQYCSSLTEVSIPQNLTVIKERAFIGTKITKIFYNGSEEEFQKITIGSFNEPIISSVVEYVDEGENGKAVNGK